MAVGPHCVGSERSMHDQVFSANFNWPMRNCIKGPTENKYHLETCPDPHHVGARGGKFWEAKRNDTLTGYVAEKKIGFKHRLAMAINLKTGFTNRLQAACPTN